MNEMIRINDWEIRQDPQGRFCLNDLHHAAGGEGRHQPSNFIRLDTTTDLVREIHSDGCHSSEVRSAPVDVVNGGPGRGTYVVRELVYAYAMWVSPAFHLKVIRTFDAVARGARVEPSSQVPLTTYVTALERVVELQQQLLQARPISVPGVRPREVEVHAPAGDPQRIAKRPRAEHPWVPSIRSWMQDNPQRVEVTSTELLGEALGLGVVTSSRQAAVGYAMKALGWGRARRRTDGKLRWVYVRPGAT